MGPGNQYAFSATGVTPGMESIFWVGYELNGYHTGMLTAKIPAFPRNNENLHTFIPVVVSGNSIAASSVYVEFGYEEFGARTDFFCTTRKDACRVVASVIDETKPFLYASEMAAMNNGSPGAYKIAIPVLPNHIVYYRVVDNGTPGPIMASVPTSGR